MRGHDVAAEVVTRHENAAARVHRDARGSAVARPLREDRFLRRERRALRLQHIPRDGEAVPSAHQQLAAKRGDRRLVIEAHVARHAAAEVRVDRIEEVGAVRALARHPTARPAEVRVRRHVQQSHRSVQIGAALVVVVVGEQVPL